METRSRTVLKHILEVVAYIGLTLVLLFFIQALVTPKYMSHPYEGAMIAEYYDADAPHDVIFLGDCEFYESVSPVTLWEEYGISSYVRGSPQQLMWHSYYVLQDTLKHEKPAVVVLNAMELKIGQVEEEAYTRMTLDGLQDLNIRLEAAEMSLTEGETLESYIFPLLRYHNRWMDLTSDDFRYLLSRDRVSFNGYLMQAEVRPQTSPSRKPPLDLRKRQFPDICWEYLDKIVDLCEAEGIQFLLFKAPTDSWQYPWYNEWDKQIVEYAEKRGITYINGVAHAEEMGLDMTQDTYDEGIHLNVYGAEKCTRFLGEVLRSQYGLADKSGDAALQEAWEPVCTAYHAARDVKNSPPYQIKEA